MTGTRFIGAAGIARFEIIGASTEDFISALAAETIPFRNFERVDELTIRISVSYRDITAIRRCARRNLCTAELMESSGLIPWIISAQSRIVYPFILIMLIPLVFWMQKHIWFMSVTGNQSVPSEQILQTLDSFQIGFWTPTDELDLNQFKNAILTQLPELSWITINTDGGFAEIVVREREEKPVISRSSVPANVVAKKPGLVMSVSVAGGTAQVSPGDIVETGELLISGVTDLEKTTMVTRAEGEVYARTWNAIDAVCEDMIPQKRYTGREKSRYGLIIGKKAINFYKSSGISYTEYDKIIKKYPLTLPGGFQLPVTLIARRYREYEILDEEMMRSDAEKLLERAVLLQLHRRLSAGEVLTYQVQQTRSSGRFRIHGIAECQEEIGLTQEMKG